MTFPIEHEATDLSVLSMLMFERRDDREILDAAVTAIPALGRCRVVAMSLTSDGGVPRTAEDEPPAASDIARQLVALDGADGPVRSSAAPWVWAVGLPGLGGTAGYILVGADEEPTDQELLLLRMLAQQTGTALAGAALLRSDADTAAELYRLNRRLVDVNEQLRSAVTDLERRRRVHEVLTAVALAGTGEQGVAAAVHDLTGLPVAVEDRFGNLRAWAGPHGPEAVDRPASRSRDEMLATAGEAARPLRHRDRVVAVVQHRDEVLGALVLVDPARRAGEHELVALEEGAIVLATEMAHQQALAETELRLRRDLIDDLLSGTDDESAVSRAAALGHDLAAPQQVLLVSWAGGARDEVVEQAVERAAATALRTRPLLVRRPEGVVVIVPRRANGDDGAQWHDLHEAVARRLRSADGSIGVGGAVTVPSQVPRSYEQARRALRIRQATTVASGVTAYGELGIYGLLASGDAEAAEDFVREWLGPLLDYDEANHTELVRTLWQYYECGGNYDSTAKVLIIHRSTLRYRLRRIRELTGYDLNSVDGKLNLHVATRAWHVLGLGRDRAPASSSPSQGETAPRTL